LIASYAASQRKLRLPGAPVTPLVARRMGPENGQHYLGQAGRFHAQPVGRRRLAITSRTIALRCHPTSLSAWGGRLIVGTIGIDTGFPPLDSARGGPAVRR